MHGTSFDDRLSLLLNFFILPVRHRTPRRDALRYRQSLVFGASRRRHPARPGSPIKSAPQTMGCCPRRGPEGLAAKTRGTF